MAKKGRRSEGRWKAGSLEGEPLRGVFAPGGELVADCHAATWDQCGMPQDYRANARHIVKACNLYGPAGRLLAQLAQRWDRDDDRDAPKLGRALRAMAAKMQEV
jgi:hypothetical protein